MMLASKWAFGRRINKAPDNICCHIRFKRFTFWRDVKWRRFVLSNHYISLKFRCFLYTKFLCLLIINMENWWAVSIYFWIPQVWHVSFWLDNNGAYLSQSVRFEILLYDLSLLFPGSKYSINKYIFCPYPVHPTLQGPVAQRLPLMVTLQLMVTTMETLISIGCWALLPW